MWTYFHRHCDVNIKFILKPHPHRKTASVPLSCKPRSCVTVTLL